MERIYLGAQLEQQDAMIAAEQETRASQNWGPQALEELRRTRREFQDAHASARIRNRR